MIPSEKSQILANAFHKYSETGDTSLIKDYKCEDIKFALLQYCSDKGFPHYDAMESRISELEKIEKESKNIKEKWKDRIIGFFFGIAISVVAGLILYFITKK
jgi:hypothetical protein